MKLHTITLNIEKYDQKLNSQLKTFSEWLSTLLAIHYSNSKTLLLRRVTAKSRCSETSKISFVQLQSIAWKMESYVLQL